MYGIPEINERKEVVNQDFFVLMWNLPLRNRLIRKQGLYYIRGGNRKYRKSVKLRVHCDLIW